MRFLLTILAVAWVWQAVPTRAAEGYITGIKPGVEQLGFSEEAGAPAKYFLNAADFEGPIQISDAKGDDWLEIVVDGEYYWVERKFVLVSRPRTASAGAMASAATAGVRLRLRSN